MAFERVHWKQLSNGSQRPPLGTKKFNSRAMQPHLSLFVPAALQADFNYVFVVKMAEAADVPEPAVDEAAAAAPASPDASRLVIQRRPSLGTRKKTYEDMFVILEPGSWRCNKCGMTVGCSRDNFDAGFLSHMARHHFLELTEADAANATQTRR